MTLHEAISQLLKEEGKPLSTREIADRINRTRLYTRRDEKPIEKAQIRSRVKNNPRLFDYVNGQVVLTSDTHWRELLTTYWYLADTLRNHFSRSDLQFMLASLIFVKRLGDLNSSHPNYEFQLPNLKVGDFFDHYNSNFPIEAIEDLSRLDRVNDSPNVFSDYGQLLSRLDVNKRLEIFKALEQLSTGYYSEEEFGPIFDYFLHLISAEFSNSTVPYTPKYLQELMVALLDPMQGRNLYDPVCGSGGLLIEALKATHGDLHAKGTEINHRMAQLGYMNLIMNGFSQTKIIAEDCMREFANPETFDYIIGDLPMNGFSNSRENEMLFHRWNLRPTVSGKGYSAPVLFVLSKLNDVGKAVITVSESLLFKGGKEREIRELLIREDLLESVISLPNGALKPYTESKASVLILNKRKPAKLANRIKFIEAKKTFSDSKTIDIDSDEVIQSHLDFESKRLKNLRVISSSKLKKDLNLSVATYSIESIEAEEMLTSGSGRKLGDLVEIRSGKSPKQQSEDKIILAGGLPVIKMENLSKDILDMHLDVDSAKLQVEPQDDYGRSILSTEGMLIARLGENLKPTYFKPTGEYPEILFHSSIFALIPKSQGDLIDLEYLYYQLNSDFVNKQVSNNRAGAVMPHISIARLKEIVIPYVSKHLQRQFIDTQKANIIASERNKVEERIRALGYEEEIEQKESDIVRTLVHELRPKLSKINVFAEKLTRLAKTHNLEELKEYSEDIKLNVDPEAEIPENLTLKEVTHKLLHDSKKLNEILATVKEVMSFNLNENDFVRADLYALIHDFIKVKRLEINNAYSLEIKGSHIEIDIHIDSMHLVLDQLIANAEKHGFTSKSKKYTIDFRIKKDEERQVAIIEYSNNGEPFALSKKEYVNFITKSKKSSGSGIGGYYINRIIKSHGGDIEIEENLKTGFRMKIVLPIKQTNE